MWTNIQISEIFAFALIWTLGQARFITTPRQARLSLAEPMPYYYHNDIDGHPGTYSYGYDVVDPATGNSQFRTEERYPNGTVVGSYGYIDAWGRPNRYKYIADERGYRVMRDRHYNQVPAQPPRPSEPFGVGSSVTWSRPQKPNTSQFMRPLDNNSTESSITWTRPKKSYKKKSNNYYPNRSSVNFIGPPSSYAED